ncbi:MAG: deoxyuridine 5'-triphosphate nucleotidohydrolase [bacterium]|nr:MAG: deoxyuridine 5'-triphosphate nucleotidohydrolase [bacterium]
MFHLKVKRLTPQAKLPMAAHPGDLGCDLFSAENAEIPPGGQHKVKTGIALEFPDGWGGVIKDRSSLAARRIYTAGGVIDAGYRGEIIVIVRNDSNTGYAVGAGDKIAQIIPVKAPSWHVAEVDELGDTTRAESGFGSTGKK